MVRWLEPWVAVEDFGWTHDKTVEYQNGWETQLKREVGPSHILFGQSAKLIARRFDTDDALFLLPDDRVAEVHLTWSRGVEVDPVWPNTAIFESLDEWAKVREQWVADRKQHLLQKWEDTSFRLRLKQIELGLRLQHRRLRAMSRAYA